MPAITVFHNPDGECINKEVGLNPDGSIRKARKPERGVYLAEKLEVPTLADLAGVLRAIGTKSDCTWSACVYPEQQLDQIVTVLPEDDLTERAKEAGIDPAPGKNPYPGLQEIDGALYAARLKVSMEQGGYLLFDRDVPDGMPPELAELSFEEWRQAMALLFPGFDQCGMVWVPSTTGRVLLDGEPISRGVSGHAFVRVTDLWTMEDQFKLGAKRSLVTSYDLEPWGDSTSIPLAFRKLNKKGAPIWWTIFDRTTAAVGRLIYSGAPTVHDARLSVLPPAVELYEGPPLDLSKVEGLEERALRDAIRRLVGPKAILELTKNGATGRASRVTGFSIRYDDLTLDTKVELADGAWTTVGALWEANAGHTRLQSPYRPESRSEAAFYEVAPDGMPFIHDMGTGESHKLSPDAFSKKTWEVIRDWIIQRYEPLYKTRDGMIYSGAEGEIIKKSMVEICPSLIPTLSMTSDAPRTQSGNVSISQLPVIFARWKGAAYSAVASTLPLEEDCPAAESSQSREVFQDQVVGLLATPKMVQLSEHETMRLMRLCDAAVKAALRVPGRWGSLDTYSIYARVVRKEVEIGFAQELISQAGMSRTMGTLTSTKLTRLCRLYGVMSNQDNRISIGNSQIRGIILSAEFVRRLNIDLESLQDLAHRLQNAPLTQPN